MVSIMKQTMYLSPSFLTCFYAPGSWRSCAKMWHRLFWPKDTDWSCSNSALEVVVRVHLCPYATDPIIILTWNQTRLFQEVQWDRKWKQRVFLVTVSQAEDFADSEIHFLLVSIDHHSTDFSAALSVYVSRGVTFCLPAIYKDNPSFR